MRVPVKHTKTYVHTRYAWKHCEIYSLLDLKLWLVNHTSKMINFRNLCRKEEGGWWCMVIISRYSLTRCFSWREPHRWTKVHTYLKSNDPVGMISMWGFVISNVVKHNIEYKHTNYLALERRIIAVNLVEEAIICTCKYITLNTIWNNGHIGVKI